MTYTKTVRFAVAAAVASAVVLANASVALAAGKSTNFSQGDTIVIVSKLNVRASADGTVIGQQQSGARGTLIAGPVNMGGYTWWNVDYSTGVDGWSAEDFMQQSNVAIHNNAGATSQTASAAASTPDSSAAIAQLQAQLAALLAQIRSLQTH